MSGTAGGIWRAVGGTGDARGVAGRCACDARGARGAVGGTGCARGAALGAGAAAVDEALQIAQEIDISGDRTFGVLTKIDIMDHGTDVKSKVMGKEVPLKLGYVGVKCRSQADIVNKIPVKNSLAVSNFV